MFFAQHWRVPGTQLVVKVLQDPSEAEEEARLGHLLAGASSDHFVQPVLPVMPLVPSTSPVALVFRREAGTPLDDLRSLTMTEFVALAHQLVKVRRHAGCGGRGLKSQRCSHRRCDWVVNATDTWYAACGLFGD